MSGYLILLDTYAIQKLAQGIDGSAGAVVVGALIAEVVQRLFFTLVQHKRLLGVAPLAILKDEEGVEAQDRLELPLSGEEINLLGVGGDVVQGPGLSRLVGTVSR